jgi:hypothetical protein
MPGKGITAGRVLLGIRLGTVLPQIAPSAAGDMLESSPYPYPQEVFTSCITVPTLAISPYERSRRRKRTENNTYAADFNALASESRFSLSSASSSGSVIRRFSCFSGCFGADRPALKKSRKCFAAAKRA